MRESVQVAGSDLDALAVEAFFTGSRLVEIPVFSCGPQRRLPDRSGPTVSKAAIDRATLLRSRESNRWFRLPLRAHFDSPLPCAYDGVDRPTADATERSGTYAAGG
jgi:hypothetical protein